MNISRLGFVFGWSLFFFAVIFLSSLYGSSVIGDPNVQLIIPTTPGILDILLFPIQAAAVFIQLMTVNSSFFILGSVIIPAFAIGMLWSLAELFRGSG